jgi:hypothetical protein
MIRLKFKVDLYEVSVIIYVLDKMSDLESIVLKKTKTKIDTDHVLGITFAWGDQEYVVAFEKDKLSHNLINHELFHLTKSITEHIDIDDEESQAWLMGFLSENVYRLLKKKGFTIEK